MFTIQSCERRLTAILLRPSVIANTDIKSPNCLALKLIKINNIKIKKILYYCAAILINFFKIFNRFVDEDANKISVDVQYCTSLNLRKSKSKFDEFRPGN